jgi:hypothetical protein
MAHIPDYIPTPEDVRAMAEHSDSFFDFKSWELTFFNILKIFLIGGAFGAASALYAALYNWWNNR